MRGSTTASRLVAFVLTLLVAFVVVQIAVLLLELALGPFFPLVALVVAALVALVVARWL